jgi:CRP-like cAMP-binding protein
MAARKTILETINLLVRQEENIVGFVKFGTHNGEDLDLWCITYKRFSRKKEFEIEKMLGKAHPNIDLYFLTRKNFNEGDIAVHTGEEVEAFFQTGLDPHHRHLHYNDTSLLAAFIYSSGKMYGNSKEKLNFESVFKDLDITYEGCTDWLNLYTLSFLRHYILNAKRTSMKYAERIAKYLIRIAFGYFAAKQVLSGKKLFKMKLFRLKGKPDKRLFTIMKQSSKDNFVHAYKKILITAVQIRTTNKKPKDLKGFITQGINLIFCWSSQVGQETRSNKGIDQFISLALTDITKEEQIITYNKGDILIREGDEKNSDIYFIPPYKKNGSINGNLLIFKNGLEINDVPPGRLIGEAKGLANIKERTATVVAKSTIEAQKIPFIKVKKILNKQADLIEKERAGKPKDEAGRRLDIFLRYLVFGSYEFLQHLVYSRSLKHKINETPASIREHNLLNSLFLGKDMEDILKQLCEEKFSLTTHPMVIKKTYKKGEYVFKKGDYAKTMFFISKGTIEIKDIALSKQSKIVLHNGCMFGESALPTFSKHRLASAYSSAFSSLYEIHALQFIRFALTFNKKYSGMSPIEVLYNLVAQNLGRLKYVNEVKYT